MHLATAVAKIGAWRAPVRLNEITRAYFRRLATISTPEEAARYLAVTGSDRAKVTAADEYFLSREPRHASMIRTSVSPNIVQGGYRVNVIPSEAKATLDVRMMPDEDTVAFLNTVRAVVGDTAVMVAYARRDVLPTTATPRWRGSVPCDRERVRSISVVPLPTMSTGAPTCVLACEGMQCYGIGPATDIEDGPRVRRPQGPGADLETEIARFVRFQWTW